MIEPITSDPIPFSAPYNPSAIDKTATYVARGSVWTGSTLWNTPTGVAVITNGNPKSGVRSEEHTSELQSHVNLVCRLLLEKKKKKKRTKSCRHRTRFRSRRPAG